MDTIETALKTFLTDYALRIVGVLVFLVIAVWLAGRLQAIVQRVLEKRKVDPTVSRFLGTLTRWGILTLAIIGALGVFGVETTSFAAILGAAGLAIGLGFQGSLSNLAAGVMLLVFRPFKVGDYIEVDGRSGTVNVIALFTTALDTLDNRRIIIPNSKVFGANIENKTFHPVRRVDVTVGVDYGADMKKTRATLEAAVASIPGRIEEPASAVVLVNLGDSSVDWQLRVWCNTSDYWGVLEATTEAAKAALDGAGIVIPFPQVDVHLDKTA